MLCIVVSDAAKYIKNVTVFSYLFVKRFTIIFVGHINAFVNSRKL